MARQPNPEVPQKIAAAAFRLFMTVGYTEATYAAIAGACGVEKSLVQYYFPQKERLVEEFFRRFLAGIRTRLTQTGAGDGGLLPFLFRIGQVYFSFLTWDEAMCRLTREILANRANTEAILTFNEDWVFSYVAAEPRLAAATRADDVLMTMGGAYELVYRDLVQGRTTDLALLMERIIRGFLSNTGFSDAEIGAVLAAYPLAPAQVAEAVAQARKPFLA